MIEYEKTYNLFERFKDKPHIGRYDESKLWAQEFGLVDRWVVTEKVDGMNLRVVVDSVDVKPELVGVYGRTDRAEMPKDLEKNVVDRFNLAGLVGELPGRYTFFGEG